MSSLNDLLEDRILLDVSADSWQESISIAGELLERSNSITAAYTQAMIDNVTENGPYIVIAPGIAFAHARSSDAVIRSCLSFVRLRTPITFGHPKNDPVHIVFALAAADSHAHIDAMRSLATLLSTKSTRQALSQAQTPEQIAEILAGGAQPNTTSTTSALKKAQANVEKQESTGHVLTVCGNGLGTSLFLKSTLEQVLERWGWSSYVSVEATDTISAKGKAQSADFVLTSDAIARTLGEIGIPVYVIENFSSPQEVDHVLRTIYDLGE
ncbi:PTS sugar transporter [Corynebacterium sp. sy017]|uniref:PTS sugar transporter subunit IIA n=1 Tax=unclassified Corynebacterium TaxID=2624378 RepID=UPI001184D182|nr:MULTISPECIES: PTS sugar transporter subunit IIA [unclassified Corynebacterium]MBP3088043.1 PTS sugar transporter [Corynebacterium sp. sy017]TSD92571.1 PTS sugar transporter [Corynebacterium sp. SY003]